MRQLSSLAASEEGSQGKALCLLFKKFPSFTWLKPRPKSLCLLLLPVLGAFNKG